MDRRRLLAALADSDPSERVAAIGALRHDSDPIVLEALRALRRDPNHAVRAYVDTILGDRGLGTSTGAAARAPIATPPRAAARVAAPRAAVIVRRPGAATTMPLPPRRLGVTVLIIAFGLLLAASLFGWRNAGTSSSYLSFVYFGFGPVWLGLTAASAMLQGATLLLLIDPRPIGYRIGLACVGLQALFTLFAFRLVMGDLRGVREFIAMHRSFGRRSQSGALSEEAGRTVLVVGVAVTLGLLAGLVVLLERNRTHFYRPSPPAPRLLRPTAHAR